MHERAWVSWGMRSVCSPHGQFQAVAQAEMGHEAIASDVQVGLDDDAVAPCIPMS